MSDHLSRDELRRDEVGEALETGVEYIATNWKRIVIGFGVLAVLAALVGLWLQSVREKQAEASYQLAQAVGGDSVETAALTEVEESYGGDAGRLAGLYRAAAEPERAAELWERVAGGDLDAVTVVANLNRVRAARKSGELDEALALLDQEGILPEDLRLYERASALQAAGRSEEVDEVVATLAADHAASPWTAAARQLAGESVAGTDGR